MEPLSNAPLPPPAPLPAGRQASALAIISLIAGILGWVMFPVVAALVAVVCGHLARGEIRREPQRFDGDGLAVAGLVLGYANLVLAAVVVMMIVLFFGGLVGLAALGAGWS